MPVHLCGYLQERQRLDEELAGREWLLAEREQELARLAQVRRCFPASGRGTGSLVLHT